MKKIMLLFGILLMIPLVQAELMWINTTTNVTIIPGINESCGYVILDAEGLEQQNMTANQSQVYLYNPKFLREINITYWNFEPLLSYCTNATSDIHTYATKWADCREASGACHVDLENKERLSEELVSENDAVKQNNTQLIIDLNNCNNQKNDFQQSLGTCNNQLSICEENLKQASNDKQTWGFGGALLTLIGYHLWRKQTEAKSSEMKQFEKR